MKYLVFICSYFILSICQAQTSGSIIYQEIEKLNIKVDGEKVNGIDLSEYMPEQMILSKRLRFNGQVSVYEANPDSEEENEFEMGSDDGSIKIKVHHEDDEDLLYIDHQQKEVIDQKKFMGKLFLVNESHAPAKWKIIGDKIKYLGYECINATTTNEEGKTIIAWFTPQLPAPVGPQSYGDLPGAILMLATEDKVIEIKAISIDLDQPIEIEKPKKGKRVTSEEYEEIVERKKEEMKANFGSGVIINMGG